MDPEVIAANIVVSDVVRLTLERQGIHPGTACASEVPSAGWADAWAFSSVGAVEGGRQEISGLGGPGSPSTCSSGGLCIPSSSLSFPLLPLPPPWMGR